MVERKPEYHCETKKVQCAVLPLIEQKDKVFETFFKEARKSFDQASLNYHEDYAIVQNEIDSLSSRGCPDCPNNSKSIALSVQALLSKKNL